MYVFTRTHVNECSCSTLHSKGCPNLLIQWHLDLTPSITVGMSFYMPNSHTNSRGKCPSIKDDFLILNLIPLTAQCLSACNPAAWLEATLKLVEL